MVIAVNAANLLDNIGLTGVPLILAILIVTTFVNFFMTSGSAKWYTHGHITVFVTIRNCSAQSTKIGSPP